MERPQAEAGLTDEEAPALVAFAATASSDHWARSALDWVDQGLWSQVVADALRQTAQDMTYSQQTRHRAWRYVKEQ
jgi:hypothetical protein